MRFTTASTLVLCATLSAILPPPLFAAPANHGLPEARFHLSFDRGFEALARGAARPAAPKTPELRQVDGIRGQGAFFAAGQSVEYAAAGNLNKSEGTLAMWVSLPDSHDDKQTPSPLTLFSEVGPGEAGSTRLSVELFPGRLIRISLKDRKDTTLTSLDVAAWQPEEWHHLALTWNRLKGALLYIDGEPAAIAWTPAWTPQDHASFILGAGTSAGQPHGGITLDEVIIADRAWTEEQARAAYVEFRPFYAHVNVRDPFIEAETSAQLRAALRNPADESLTLETLRYEVIDADGRVQQDGRLPDQTLAARAHQDVTIKLAPVPAGPLTLRLHYTERNEEKVVQTPLRSMTNRPAPAAREADLELLAEIDAVTQSPVAQTGGTTVVEVAMGKYVEAGPHAHDRFALDFTITDVNEPHLAVITYPDDKPRTMEVLLQDFGNIIDFQVHSGIYAGGEFPNSRQMLEHRVVFWPRSARQAFTFMTAENGLPAAVAGIKIYRLNTFAVTSRQGMFSGSVPPRSVGLYYEDPVLFHSFGTGTDLAGFTQATDRLVEYLDSFGQTEFEYPLAWYAGPLYGTDVQPIEPDIAGAQGGNRAHPPGYPLYLLKRLGERGMTFTGGLHIHTLPSLDRHAIVDRARIAAGEDTVININKDGRLWYGYWHGSDLNYNAGDPRVLAAVNEVVDEVTARYAQEPAFDGIALIISRTKIYSFGSLASGYNDSNLRRFQSETGVTIPVYAAHDPERHAKSYRWLMDNAAAKEAWIDWRCQLLYRHYVAMSERMTAVRPDLKLKLNVFLHPSHNGRLADYLEESGIGVMREMGIDPALFKNHPNIVLSPTVVPADYRWMRRSAYLPETPGVSRAVFTAPEVLSPLKDHDDVRVTIHDRYWEDAIGREQPLPGLTDLGVREMVWRASTLNPARFHSLEPYVFALHHLDATSVVKGGYVIGTFGMEKELEAFARAFQTLPAVKFDDVPAAVDPVRIRQKTVDGRLYFYVLNTLPTTVSATLHLSETGDVVEPSDGSSHPVRGGLELALEPYELRVFTAAGSQRIQDVATEVDHTWRAQLEQRHRALAAAAATQPDQATDRAPYLDLADRAWTSGHYSRLYFLLQEQWAQDLLGETVAPAPAEPADA